MPQRGNTTVPEDGPVPFHQYEAHTLQRRFLYQGVPSIFAD